MPRILENFIDSRKDYLDFLLEIIEELELPHIFVHSDEMVYSKLCAIVWKNHQLYKGIILLMGGFHQLRVMQNSFSKDTLAEGSKTGSQMLES